MLIHTPRLCAERLFLEGRTDTVAPAAPIECQPVVRQLPKEIAGEEEATSSVQKAATTDEGVVRTELDTPEEPAPLVAPSEEPVQPEQLDEHLDDDQEDFVDDASYEEEQETMLTLVYDPETGEIESAVTDSGEDVFLDSALRRMLFGEDDATEIAATDVRSGQSRNEEEPHGHMEADGGIADLRQLVSLRAPNQFTHSRQDRKAQISPFITSQIHDSISDALRTYAAQSQGGAAVAPAAGEAGAEAAQLQATPPLLHQPLDEVVQSLLEAVRTPQQEEEEDQTEAQLGTDKKQQQQQRPVQQREQGSTPKQQQNKMMQPGLHRYLQQFERERKTVQVPQKAVLGSDEHERLKRRFARRYDEAQHHDERAESGSSAGADRVEEEERQRVEERVRDEL